MASPLSLPELANAANLKELVAVLAPGLIVLGVRQSFVAAPPPEAKERAVNYAAFSAIYYAVANPSFGFLSLAYRVPPFAIQAMEYVGLPLLLGLLAGIATQKDWLSPLWDRLGVRPVHHAPTAWDFAFSRANEGAFVLVTLTDETKIAGAYSKGSFASSSSGERDILIREMWQAGDEGFVPLKEARSILICGRDIRFIEFYNGD